MNTVLKFLARSTVAIAESHRKFRWPAPGPRPADHPGIPDVQ